MFSTCVTCVCLVRKEGDVLEHAAVILTPLLYENQMLRSGVLFIFPYKHMMGSQTRHKSFHVCPLISFWDQ